MDSQGKYVFDSMKFILRHISNYTFTFAIAGFYAGQLMLSYTGKTAPEGSKAFETVGTFIVTSIVGIVVGGICAIPLVLCSSMTMKVGLWVALLGFAVIPILVAYPVLMYYSTVLLIWHHEKRENQSFTLPSLTSLEDPGRR